MPFLGENENTQTEGEPIGSHELFSRLISKKTITGEDEEEESELKYLKAIKGIRDNNPDLFGKVKQLPKKARTAKELVEKGNHLLTYFRKGSIQKFFIANGGQESQELDFMSAAGFLETGADTPRREIPKDYYNLLEGNKQSFVYATTEEMPEAKSRRGRDAAANILGILKAIQKDLRQFTEEQELYLKKVIAALAEGALPRQTTKRTLQALQKEIKENGAQPLRILGVLQNNIPAGLLGEHLAESSAQTLGPREVILSEYLVNK